jgi:hypothetical protein
MNWDEFLVLFHKQFCPPSELGKLKSEFLKLELGTMTQMNYAAKFNELSDFLLHLVQTEDSRINRYQFGLSSEIRTFIKSTMPKTYSDAVEVGATIAGELSQRNTAQPPFKRKWSDIGTVDRHKLNDRSKKGVRGSNAPDEAFMKMPEPEELSKL